MAIDLNYLTTHHQYQLLQRDHLLTGSLGLICCKVSKANNLKSLKIFNGFANGINQLKLLKEEVIFFECSSFFF